MFVQYEIQTQDSFGVARNSSLTHIIMCSKSENCRYSFTAREFFLLKEKLKLSMY